MEADESIFEFPCDFPIKAMGKADEDFDCLVVSLVRKHCPCLKEGAVETRLSAGGKYISVTVTIQAESREQLDNIYLDLTAESRVLVAL
jgi:putative lipoic acid-binding regulatory protein